MATSCTKQINKENCKMHYPKIPSKSDEGFVKTSENIATPILTVFLEGVKFHIHASISVKFGTTKVHRCEKT